MKNWIFLAVIILLSLIQVVFLDCLRFFSIKPDILLIAVMFLALYFEFRWAIALSLLSGLLKDIFTLNQFGISTILFPLWCCLIIKLSRKISLDNYFIIIAAIFLVTFLNNAATRIILLFFGVSFPLGLFARIAVVESFYNALLLPLLFLGLKRIISPFTIRRGGIFRA